MKFSVVAALALPFFASAAVHKVQVAKGGALKFTPATVKAAVGDTIEFVFDSSGHSVVQGDFKTGCSAASGGFNSGGKSSGQTYTYKVKNTNPTPFFCDTPGHCTAGMYGVINPSTTDSLAEYKKLVG